jgi:hypothetical protein
MSPLNRRPVAATILTFALLLGACGDDAEVVGDPTTTSDASGPASSSTTAAPTTTTAGEIVEPDPVAGCAAIDDVPPLVVADGSDVVAVESGQRTPLVSFDDEAWLAFGDGAGLVVASTRVGTGPGSKSQGWIVDDGTPREIVEESSPGVLVYELTMVDGSPVVIYGPLRDIDTPGAPESTPVVAARVDGTDRWGLGDAYAPEWGITSASAADGFVVFSAVSDLTESVFTTTVRDPLVLDDRFAPKAEYNAPPLVTNAVLHPDGTQLAWIEGPDWDGATNASTDDPWQLVVADAETGTETFRRSILGSVEAILHLEWTGELAVVSRFDAPPLLVDTADVAAPMVEACDVRGVAKLTRPRSS